MILIDEDAETKLAHELKYPGSRLVGMRCLHFKLAGYKNLENIRHPLATAAQMHIAGLQTQLFFCEDGDAFLFAPAMTDKQARKVIVDAAVALNVPADDGIADSYEFSMDRGRLLRLVEKKIETREAAQTAIRQQQAQQAMERKRAGILDNEIAGTRDIAARRCGRAAPELMIIEDDPFSIRLVLNALQKQYKLTGLESAERALATYMSLAPDILFLDINLPDVTGHELLQKIIALDPDAYVVMLSGNADKENVTQAVGLGAKGFVAKPFSRDKLFQYIERCPTIKKEHLQ